MIGGSSFGVYSGARRQRGGGFFGSMRRFMVPIGRTALSGIKRIAANKTVQKIAKKAAEKGAEVLTTAAVDALQGRNFGEALKNRSREVALTTLTGQAATPRPSQRRRLKQSRKRALPMSDKYSSIATPPPPPKRRRKKSTRASIHRKELF